MAAAGVTVRQTVLIGDRAEPGRRRGGPDRRPLADQIRKGRRRLANPPWITRSSAYSCSDR